MKYAPFVSIYLCGVLVEHCWLFFDLGVCVCVVTVAYCSMPTETDNRPARKNRYYCTHKYAQCFVTIQKPNNKNDTEKNVIHKW